VCAAAEVVAHRGASQDAPENTLAAVKLGLEQGADAVEIDVHLSRDGKIVVLHDDDTKRTAGLDKKVADQTLDELRGLDVGRFGPWQGKGFSERIPTLDEVLALVPAGKRVFVEIKCGVEILPALEQSLRGSRLSPYQTAIISFQYAVVEAAKRRFPDRRVYWLHGYDKDKKTGEFPRIEDLVRRAKEARLDGLNLNHQFPLDGAAVRRVKDTGLTCYVWTVDDPAKARELVKAGVDGITTNRPGALRRELERPR
jgi:glycerophosphoryl diester phosphodiesterase